ncbi:MAG: hypothetical protein IH843_05095 [Thaumarchaeota archaeon]|nr:hypothetical protein [Nitrososphaerota archaeon]
MTHLELMEEILHLAEKGTGSGPAEKKITEEFLDYIKGVEKGMNQKSDHFLRKKISQRVADKQGCKMTELAAEIDLIEEAHNKNVNFVDEIYGMIRDGELVEVEYILPNIDYRIKSYLFPDGTDVKIGNEHKLIASLRGQIAEYKREQY